MRIGKVTLCILIAVILTILAAVAFPVKGFIVMIVIDVLVIGYLGYPLVYSMKAWQKYREGDDRASLVCFEKAYKSRACSPMVALHYTYQLIRLSNTKRAEFILNDMMLSSKKLTKQEKWLVKQNLSLVMYKTGRFFEARELMEDVFSESKTTATYGTLGYYKILADGFDSALIFCEKAYEFNEDDPVISDNLLTVYIGLDRWEDAKKISDAVMAKEGKKILELYYHAAQIEHQLGHEKKAEEYINLSLAAKRSFLTTVPSEAADALKESILEGTCAKKSNIN